MGRTICEPYFDQYSRPTDLMHVAKGATYPINILGNAATADVANNPIVDLDAESTDTIAFRSGNEIDDASNEFRHRITKVEEANKAEKDSEGNVIVDTYAKKDDVVVLDPETGKVPTGILPDTANNVNFVNGKTGNVTLDAEDISFDVDDTIKAKVDAIVVDTNTAIQALNESKADKFSIGENLVESENQIDAYAYSAEQVGNEFRLKKTNPITGEETNVSNFGINANALFNFAPVSQVFDLSTNLHVRIDWKNASLYNMAYLEMLDKTTGTWHIHNDSDSPIYCLRFGGRFNSGARISPMPHGDYIDPNNEITFYLDSDDPYLDRNSFGILVWKLANN